nr:cdc42 effector protein 3-like [Nothobranchius furzeri]XP_054597515.1 cdc42 effector protein 3-like [Nothobranchius furzeri]
MPLRTSLHRKSSHWSSRKRREVLSVNMISLPLDDFRHISHIGIDAQKDSFGDLSFLKMSHNLLRQTSQSEQNLILACSPPPKPPRLNLDGKGDLQSHDLCVNQKKTKCSSLPLLDSEEDGKLDKEEEYQRDIVSSQTDGPGRGSVSSGVGGASKESCDKTTEQMDEDSGFSFSVDLGPSILGDILQVMDKLHH